ncbi:MAG: FAD-dependent oxidoreductase [Planctomycetes bacterium]|nr:FAD-dependent oxidoreductase [Planctomycetota bacterium]
MRPRHLVVLGAGVHGLCTAFWLVRAGARVTVLEQFGPGHDRGSSHGGTRITRSSYDDPAFVRLAQDAHQKGWPTLERALGKPLRLPTPGLFFGPPRGLFADYLATTLGSGAAVERLPLAAARTRFPLLRFAEDEQVLLDHTAAVLLAAATMQGLRTWLEAAGASLHFHTRATMVAPGPDGCRVATEHGELAADRVAVAIGPYATPALTGCEPVAVLHQQVGYFDVEAAPSATQAGTFPVWARIGADAEDFVYGLPDVDAAGLKLARHVTTGRGGDPAVPPEPDLTALRTLAARHLTSPSASLRRHERCLYTMATGHQLRVDPVGPLPGVVAITACSGHAFKFAPELGRLAAAMLLDEPTDAPCFGIERTPPTGKTGAR